MSLHTLHVVALTRAVQPAVVVVLVAECISANASAGAKLKATKHLEHCAICQGYQKCYRDKRATRCHPALNFRYLGDLRDERESVIGQIDALSQPHAERAIWFRYPNESLRFCVTCGCFYHSDMVVVGTSPFNL